MPAEDLADPLASAGGDASDFDRADRDRARDFRVPSTQADGYKPESKKELR